MQRPVEIVWFERIMFGTLALGIVHSALLWSITRSTVGPGFALIAPSIVLAIYISLTLLVSRRRSSVAKWLIIAFSVFGLPIFISEVVSGRYVGVPAITFVQIVGELLAFGLLFTDASRRWFRREQNPT